MSELFLKILNMSLVSSIMILVLVMLRPLLKKAPSSLSCALWGLVGIRLVCPFTFESILSLIPDPEPVSKEAFASFEAVMSKAAQLDAGSVTNIISNTLASPAGASINPMQAISLVAAFIWAVGVAVMLIISLVSYIRLNKTLSASLTTGGNVFINDSIPSPFVLGILKPKIYIPSALTEYEKAYVIAHENAHIKRRDYLFKPLGYLILSLHWFNPFVWVAYILLCRDIESACDQKVISKMNSEEKREYSEILLKLSLPTKKIRACPVAFGEVGVKSRIKGVASYKKPAFVLSFVAVVLVAAFAIGFLTNPVSADEESVPNTIDKAISEAIVRNNKTEFSDLRFCAENYVELKTLTFKSDITTYVWAYYGEFEQTDDSVKLSFESYKPAKIRIKYHNGTYIVVEYSTYDNKHNTAWIKENIPEEIEQSVMYIPGYANDQKNAALRLAKKHFGVNTDVNEFYPTFNAEVLEVTDKRIYVAPLKGESVCGNTFEKVALSTKKLSPTSYHPFVGDIVRVRYMDLITVDSDPPVLPTVFNLDLVKSDVGSELPFVLYSGGEGAYYLKEPAQDKVYVYKSEGADLWLPGNYFCINEDNRTFMMAYEKEADVKSLQPYSSIKYIDHSGAYTTYAGTGDSDSDANLTTVCYVSGDISYNDDDMVLQADNTDWIYMYFIKDGDSYVFSESRSREWLSWYLEDFYLEDDFLNFPFKSGDAFTLAEAI